MRAVLKQMFLVLPAPAQAALDYTLRPRVRHGFGALNGQAARQRLVHSLMGFGVARVVETGTFRGTTTEWFARFGVDVWTVEADPRWYWYSRLRLWRWRTRPLAGRVRLERGDSTARLAEWIRRGEFADGLTLAYLDAHWHERVPLRDEVRLIVEEVREHIILIDDFEVPGDPGYGFDDYGPGKRLCLDHLRPLAPLGLHVFFPATPSTEETGYRRGCCVLTAHEALAGRLRGLPELRPYGRLH